MSELDQEMDAILAIFPDGVESLGPSMVGITVPSHPDVTLQLAFPPAYPEEAPTIIQAVTRDARKYPDGSYIESRFQEIIDRVFRAGEVVLFELIGEIEMFLEEYEEKHKKELQEMNEKLTRLHIKQAESPKEASPAPTPEPEIKPPKKEIDYTKGWIQSEPIVDRASTFIGFAREVHSVEEAENWVSHLTCDRKIAKATHNMTAYRIKGENNVVYQDCDDDGETAAGSRMLHLLTIMDVWDVIVVVSRWYGGTHLGPDRFKHINAATRDVLIKGKFYSETKKKKK